MQNRILNTFIVLIGIILLASCTDKYITQPYVAPGYQYSLNTDVQPIFTGNCISCHKTGFTAPDLTTGNSYVSLTSLNLLNTSNPANSTLYKKMSTGSMANYCTSQDADVVLKWITQGAKDN